MNNDRTELHDLSYANQPVVKALERQFDAWTEQVGVVAWSRLIAKLQLAWNTTDVPGI